MRAPLGVASLALAAVVRSAGQGLQPPSPPPLPVWPYHQGQDTVTSSATTSTSDTSLSPWVGIAGCNSWTALDPEYATVRLPRAKTAFGPSWLCQLTAPPPPRQLVGNAEVSVSPNNLDYLYWTGDGRVLCCNPPLATQPSSAG